MFFIWRTKNGRPSMVVQPSRRSLEACKARCPETTLIPSCLPTSGKGEDIRTVRGSNRFFHLQEEGIVVAIAEQHRQISAGSHTSYPHHPVSDVGNVIAAKHVSQLASQRVSVCIQTVNDFFLRRHGQYG